MHEPTGRRGAGVCAGKKRYYLALDNSAQGNYSSNVAFFFVYMVTYWLLFSYLVPISLFVTIEIVKFIQVREHKSFWLQPSLSAGMVTVGRLGKALLGCAAPGTKLPAAARAQTTAAARRH